MPAPSKVISDPLPYPERPTRDRIVMQLEDNERKGVPGLPKSLGDILGLSKGAVGDQLKLLAQEQLVISVKPSGRMRGVWWLTEAGRQHALSCKGERRVEEIASLVDTVSGRDLPYYGKIAAGPPRLMADTPLDTYTLQGADFDPDQYFVMEVEGESMRNEGILPGDVAIFRRVDRWTDITTDTIVAAAVPADAVPELPEWLERTMRALVSDEQIDEESLVLDHVTLKKIDVQTRMLVGRYGSIHTVFAPIGVLVQLRRTYDDGTRYRKA